MTPGPRAWAAVGVLPPLVHAANLRRLTRWTGRLGERDDALDDAALAAWVDRTLRRAPWPWRWTCLKRNLVLFHLLRRAGRPVRLHVGVRRDGAALRAHAWLTLDGAVWLETDPHHPSGFAEITAFPESR